MPVRLRITEGQRMLARNVWRLRELRGMSAEALADKLGWQLAAVEAMERAEKPDITLDDIDRMAEALAAEPFDLFRRSCQ